MRFNLSKAQSIALYLLAVFLKHWTRLQKRGMARIQRTHHPIFQGHLDTSTFSPIDDDTGPQTAPAGPAPAPAPQASPSEEADAQVLNSNQAPG